MEAKVYGLIEQVATFGVPLQVSHGTDHDVPRAEAVGGVRDGEIRLAHHLCRLHYLRAEN